MRDAAVDVGVEIVVVAVGAALEGVEIAAGGHADMEDDIDLILEVAE